MYTNKTNRSYERNEESLDYDNEFYDNEFFSGLPQMRLQPRMFTRYAVTKQPVRTQPVAVRPNIINNPRNGSTMGQAIRGYNNSPNRNYNPPSELNQFDVTVTKVVTGAGINADLPFVLFAPALLVSDYIPLIKQFVPAGVTLSVVKDAERIVFTYTDTAGGVVELIVTSNITSYPTIVNSLTTDKMNIIQIRETLGDTNILAQLSESLRISNGSMFGGFSSNPISAPSQKSPFQFQQGILDFADLNIPLDKFRGILSFITNSAPTNFENTYSFWVTNVYKG